MQKTQPLVSIIIPTYNRPELLKRAIQSVLTQTYKNIEIIVVDDNSDLDLNHFREEYSSVSFLTNSENRGACYSRNRGFEEANGEYVNFLDDDDELYPEKIERQIERFKVSDDEKLGMITCHLIDQRSGKEVTVRNKVRGDIYRELLARYAVSGTETMLFKKKVLQKVGVFDETLPANQEYDLLIRVCEKYSVDFIDEVLTKKHRSVNQINTNFEKKITGAKRLYNKHRERFKRESKGFFLKMWIKYRLLNVRFYIGKWFGEKVYRLTIRD